MSEQSIMDKCLEQAKLYGTRAPDREATVIAPDPHASRINAAHKAALRREADTLIGKVRRAWRPTRRDRIAKASRPKSAPILAPEATLEVWSEPARIVASITLHDARVYPALVYKPGFGG
jgi:hypothetical protein